MPCERCGSYTDPDQTLCSNCQTEPKVTVLPPEEQANFNGLTIEQNLDGSESQQSQSDSGYFRPHGYVRHFNFGSIGLLTKLLLGVVFLLVLMIALPLALIFLAFLIIRWLLFKRPSR